MFVFELAMDVSIDQQIASLKTIHPGWYCLVVIVREYLRKIGGVLVGVKEKWGGLRFEANGDDRVSWVCMLAEAISFRMCNKCGGFGKLCVQQDNQLTFCTGCAGLNGYVALQNAEEATKTGTPSSNGFVEATKACPGFLIVAATTSTEVRKAGGTITKFEIQNGRLRSNWDCKGDQQAKDRVKALCLFANELSSRISPTTGKPL